MYSAFGRDVNLQEHGQQKSTSGPPRFHVLIPKPITVMKFYSHDHALFHGTADLILRAEPSPASPDSYRIA